MSETTSLPYMSSSLLTVTKSTASGMMTVAFGVGGNVAAFSPSQLTGLSIWLDATQISGVVSGTSLSAWTDLSGQNHTVSNSFATQPPLYLTNIQNALPTVRFDGVDDSLGTTFTLNQPVTYFAACVKRDAGAGNTYIDGPPGAGGGTVRLGSNIIAGNAKAQSYAGTTGINSGITMLQNNAYTLIAVYNNASSVLRVGSVETTGTVGTNNPGGFSLALINIGGQWAQVDICECGAYNRVLSSTERISLSGYLTSKWSTL